MEKLKKLKEVDWKHLKWKDIKDLYFEFKEIINYLVFGVLAMVVNFVSYYIFARIFNIDEVVSSGLSWFCSVLFAYITNKLFVFDSKTEGKKGLLKEAISFFLARIVSGILCDVGTFALMVKVLHINDIVSKVVTQVMVVIMNYVFSKFFVFKKKEENNKE